MSIDPSVQPDEQTPTPVPGPESNSTSEPEEVKAAVEESTESEKIIVEQEPEEPKVHPQDEALAQMGEMKVYKLGDLVEGSIVQVTDDQLIVDIGTKTEGIINRDEISYGPTADMTMFNVGDKVSAIVINEDDEGTYTLSKRRADQHLVWDKVEESQTKGTRIPATGFRAVKGGLLVDIGTIAFLPQSLVDIKRVDDLEPYVGQKFDVKVVEYDRNAKPHPKIVVSRRAILEEDLTRERDAIYDSIDPNSVIDGKVIKLTDYGAFIDIGGLQGLLHISEMSLGRINHPSEVMKEGDTIKVKVLKVDKKRKRISLGRRDLLPNPWDVVHEKFKPGQVVEGTVVRVADFGAFIKLDDYFEGLAHISELVDNKISHAREVFKQGDKVDVLIMKIDKKYKRIKLSVRRAADAQTKAEVKEFLKTQSDLGDMFGMQLKEALKESDLDLKVEKAETEAPAEKTDDKAEAKPEPEPEAEAKPEKVKPEAEATEKPASEPEAKVDEAAANDKVEEPVAESPEESASDEAPAEETTADTPDEETTADVPTREAPVEPAKEEENAADEPVSTEDEGTPL